MIIVSPPVPIGLGFGFWTALGLGFGLRGLDLGLGLDNFISFINYSLMQPNKQKKNLFIYLKLF